MMFVNKPKYETRGINEGLCIDYKIFMWDLINRLSEEMELDYLQVFDLSIEDGVQKITHRQEVPEYEKFYTIPKINEGIEGKVFVIDDGDYCTMLWSNEY